MPTMTAPRKPALTPARIRAIRKGLGLTVAQAAAKVGVTPRGWKSWEIPSQQRHPSPSHVILIRLMEAGVI